MAEITGLADYPLTGARARQLEAAEINPGGMLMNRILVAYRLGDVGFERIGQKQFPELAQFEVEIDEEPVPHFLISRGEHTRWGEPSWWIRLFEDEDHLSGPDTHVNEFGDATPVIRRISAGRWLSRELVATDDLIHLGQKPLSWQRGEGRDMSQAAVAPLHVVTKQSVEHAKSLINREKVSDEKAAAVTEDRLRANIVIDAPEHDPLSELDIAALRIGDLTLVKARDTERCNVPGIDQQTGENMQDLPLAYKNLPRSAAGIAVLGAYFYPLLEQGEEVTVCRGDDVEFIFAGRES